MKVERANIEDIPQLCELLKALFTQESDFEPDMERQITGLTEIISNPETGTIFVVRDSREIIGMVTLLFTISTALGGKVAILEDMIVSPNARGSGVGSHLLEYVESYSRNNNINRITLLTDHDNQISHNFYKNFNYEKSRMVVFRKTIS